MTYAPKGPFGEVIHEDPEYQCQRRCGYRIRTPERELGQQWLQEHDCDEPHAWEPKDEDG